MRRRLRARIAAVVALALAATGVAAGPAAADSIVYVRDGNVFLASPDGARGYQLTFDGGWSSPSQADDGTIGAIRDRRLIRMDRSGRLLNAPVDAIGSPGVDRGVGGPYDARLSPDGTRFAYWFFIQTSYDDHGRGIRFITTGANGTWSYGDRFTDPSTESEYYKSFKEPEWVAGDRLLGNQDFWMNMWTWKLGTGHGYTSDAAQFWFGLQDPPDEYGVGAYHWYDDPALSRDGTRLAMTDETSFGVHARLLVASASGAWRGEPPYQNDYAYGTSEVPPPEVRCERAGVSIRNPSWSPDGRTLAYTDVDGLHVLLMADGIDCTQDRLIVPGATEAAYGPAGVDMAQQPSPPPAGTQAGAQPGQVQTPPPAVRFSGVSLRPSTLRPGARARLRYRLSHPSRVALTVRKGRRRIGRPVALPGARGTHTTAFRGRVRGRALRPGRYRLVLTARPRDGGPRTTRAIPFRMAR